MDPTSQPSQWTDSPSPSPFGRLPSPFGPFDEPNSSSWIHEPVDGLPCVPPDAPVTGDSNSQVQETPVQFNTAVDNVVRMIQAKPEILGLEVKAEPRQTEEEKDEGRDSRQLQRGKAKRKRFACDIPGCNKMFAQKNNLDTHRRSHTGESPYPCPYCPRRFTQVVNLNVRSHRTLPSSLTRPHISPSLTSTAIPERGPTSVPSAPRRSPSGQTSRHTARHTSRGSSGPTGSAGLATVRRPLPRRATSRCVLAVPVLASPSCLLLEQPD